MVYRGYVKTFGQRACAAPPGTDPELALSTLGEVDLQVERLLAGAMALGPALAAQLQRLDVDISHPSHSGMQRDQITLLYIPMRYVETLQIGMDDEAYATMTGSVSLSENPACASRCRVPRARACDDDRHERHHHHGRQGPDRD